MNKKQPARKPLRQRVADRKRGIKEVRPISERKRKILKAVSLILMTSQYLGLLLLLLSLGGIVTDNYEINNATLIIVYCTMFLVGRFGVMIMRTTSMFK